MAKWYVEYKVNRYGRFETEYIGKIEAKDGKAAIEVVKNKVIGAHHFKVWHDDDEE